MKRLFRVNSFLLSLTLRETNYVTWPTSWIRTYRVRVWMCLFRRSPASSGKILHFVIYFIYINICTSMEFLVCSIQQSSYHTQPTHIFVTSRNWKHHGVLSHAKPFHSLVGFIGECIWSDEEFLVSIYVVLSFGMQVSFISSRFKFTCVCL